MNPVRTVFNKKWIPFKCQVDFFVETSPVDFDAPVTTVHGFFLKDSKLLLVKHKNRGWEVPGGHINDGESYEAAMRRELEEEAQMSCGNLLWLGYLKKSALEDAPNECNYPHPLSYCIFFGGEIASCDKFVGDKSIVDAAFFHYEEAIKVPWVKAYIEYYEKLCELK